jgi:hypothetical protein
MKKEKKISTMSTRSERDSGWWTTRTGGGGKAEDRREMNRDEEK